MGGREIDRLVKILAWIHLIMGGGLLAAAIVLVTGFFFLSGPAYVHETPFLIGLASWLALVLFIPSLVGGIGLLRKKRRARVLIIFLSVEFLFVFPVGTALGAYGLWALLRRDPELPAAEQSATSRRIRHSRKNLLLAMLSVAAAFVLVIGGGFLVSRAATPMRMDRVLGVTAGIVLVATAFTMAHLLGVPLGIKTASPKPKLPAEAPKILVNPVSEELRSTYASNSKLTITCPHLQPFERAMRDAGITVVPTGKSIVAAQCRIYRRGLKGPFKLPESVVYREYYEAERYQEDFPMARLQCTPCLSWISVLHPAECNLNASWFPAAPPPLILRAEQELPSGLEVTAMASSPDGKLIAVAAGTYNTTPEFFIFDRRLAKLVKRLPSHGVIRSIAWMSDKLLVTGRGILWSQGQGQEGPSIFVWDAETGSELLRCGPEYFGVRGIAVSPDGQTLLASGMLGKTAAEGSTLDLWELSSGHLLRRLARIDPQAHETLPFFSGVAFTPDSSVALAACERYRMPVNLRRQDKSEVPAWWHRGVRAFRLSDNTELELPGLYQPIRSITVSRDGTRLMFYGGRFGMWDLKNRSILWDKTNGYEIGIAASPDCHVIARGTGYRVDNHGPYVDTAVELYDGATGELLSWGAHRTPPSAIAFTSGTSIVAGGEDGELRLWEWSESS